MARAPRQFIANYKVECYCSCHFLHALPVCAHVFVFCPRLWLWPRECAQCVHSRSRTSARIQPNRMLEWTCGKLPVVGQCATRRLAESRGLGNKFLGRFSRLTALTQRSVRVRKPCAAFTIRARNAGGPLGGAKQRRRRMPLSCTSSTTSAQRAITLTQGNYVVASPWCCARRLVRVCFLLCHLLGCVEVSRKTVIRRLGEKGFVAQKKLDKHDPGPALARRRKNFAQRHEARSKEDWKTFLQVRSSCLRMRACNVLSTKGVGDIKVFVFLTCSSYMLFHARLWLAIYILPA